MFVESFTLKKNSWHTKLMKLIWRLNPRDFSHMCPYFWLTIFNVIIFIPYIVILGGLLKIISWPISKLINSIEEFNQELRWRKAEKLINDPDTISRLYTYSEAKLRRIEKLIYDARFLPGFNYDNHYDKWSEIYDYIKTQRVIAYKVESKNKEATKLRYKTAISNNKQFIVKILSYIKPVTIIIMYLAGAVICVALCYALYLLFSAVISINYNWPDILEFLTISSIVILSLVIAYHAGKILVSAAQELESRHFSWLTTFFNWLWVGICLIVNIIVQIFHNNCPAIDWTEDK